LNNALIEMSRHNVAALNNALIEMSRHNVAALNNALIEPALNWLGHRALRAVFFVSL
jgi:hypothetical protein